MSVITRLANLLSSDVTTQLVAGGFGLPAMTVTGATNATPIVLTFSAAHNLAANALASVTVSGVGGNTAANGNLLALVQSPTTVALYSMDATGTQSPVAGTGAYTSGGTAQWALRDGGIVVGQVHVEEMVDAPRVILIPKRSRFGPPMWPNRQATTTTTNKLAQGAGVRSYTVTVQGSGYAPGDTATVAAPDIAAGATATATLVLDAAGHVLRVLAATTGSGYLKAPAVTFGTSTGSGAAATANLDRSAEMLLQLEQQPIWTEYVTFEVQVFGGSQTQSGETYENDFDATQTLYQQVMASAWLLSPRGVSDPGTLSWAESAAGTTQIALRGHVVTFDLEFATPLMRAPLQYANPQVRPALTDNMQAIDTGTVETGWTGTA